jgi:hypothetical protein
MTILGEFERKTFRQVGQPRWTNSAQALWDQLEVRGNDPSVCSVLNIHREAFDEDDAVGGSVRVSMS